jgi:hypothetical protein
VFFLPEDFPERENVRRIACMFFASNNRGIWLRLVPNNVLLIGIRLGIRGR